MQSASSENKVGGGTSQQKSCASQSASFKKRQPSLCSSRKVLANINNSPAALNPSTKSTDVPDPGPIASQKEIEFEVDPNALASILNNEGIKMSENSNGKVRGSLVANNTLLLADGRPSLCRRVPVRLTENGGRPSTTGAQRIVSAKKGTVPGNSVSQNRSSFRRPPASRHSLYSVIEGRYSLNSAQPARQSFHQGQKAKPPAKPEKSSDALALKSPAQRMISRKQEVRVSASPALRVAIPVPTYSPGRVLKKERKTAVKWADENSPLGKDKLAIHLFKESPHGPKVLSKKVGKTPVSILKSRKHFKRNSLTPPIIKKERKHEDDDCVIDVVTPQLLNAQLPVEKQKGSSSAAGNDAILAGGDFKNRTRFAPPAVEAGVEIQNQEAAMTQKKLVDINEVLETMTGHASKLKRRSVQAEFCDVITHVKNRLNAPPFCDAI